MRWTVSTPPTAEPVTVAEARLQLGLTEGAGEDLRVKGLIQAAREHVERVCERALMPQRWRISFDAFPSGCLEIPGGLVRAIDSVVYVDAESYTGTYVRSGTTVTVTLTGHSYIVGDAVAVTAADDADLQGGQTVTTAADANTFTFEDSDAAGATTGSITVLGRRQTLTGYQTDLERQPARLFPASGVWPQAASGRVNAVQVIAQVGYAKASEVPAALRAAILLLVGDLNENREGAIVGLSHVENPTLKALMRPYRRVIP